MLRGLFKLYLLRRLFGGAGRTGGRGGRGGRGGCGMGAGCLVLILIVVLGFVLLRGCDGGGGAPIYDF